MFYASYLSLLRAAHIPLLEWYLNEMIKHKHAFTIRYISIPTGPSMNLSKSIKAVHHIAIIASQKTPALGFYVDLLGFQVISETIRDDASVKIDLVMGNICAIELFIFVNAPKRVTYPEALGLRHIAFDVLDIDAFIKTCEIAGVAAEPVRFDSVDKKRFTFIFDPDGLPIEICERNREEIEKTEEMLYLERSSPVVKG